MSTAQESNIEQIPAWKLEGLPGRPALLCDGKIQWIPITDLLRDERGKVITAPRHGEAETLMSECLGKTIEAISILPAGYQGTIHSGAFADTIAFRYTGKGRLSILERRTVAAFAWFASKYYSPMKRRDQIVFPAALAAVPKELESPRLLPLMWKALTEDKAYQVASVLEAMFGGVQTVVFEEGDGWHVAVEQGQFELEGTRELEQVETILWMLSEFDVVPNEGGMMPYGAGLNVDLDKDEHIECRSVRAFNAYNAQQRIETAIGEILSLLNQNAATGAETAPVDLDASIATGVELVTNIEASARKDRHATRQAKPVGKKSAAKRSA